jgi:two-component system, LytTR family, sensor kinase
MYKLLENKKKLFWILHISGWILFSLVMQVYQPFGYFQSAKGFLLFFFTYFIGFSLTLGLRYLYRLVFARVKSIYKILLIILISSFVVNTIWEPIDSLISSFFWSDEQLAYHINRYKSLTLLNYYQNNLIWFLFIYTWSALYFGINGWISYVDQKIMAERNNTYAKMAQLQMLRYQLNPHFLFNSLNSIQGLMYKDVKKADIMLTELSEFLRYTLKFKDDIFISLKDEFEIIEKYLFIEKIRFSDKLDYSINIPNSLENCRILCFLTQPFVENAFKHGLKSNPYGKINVKVDATKENNSLVIVIQNSGKWISNKDSLGTGVTNVRERLNKAYPEKYSLNIFEVGNTVKVEIKIPCNE